MHDPSHLVATIKVPWPHGMRWPGHHATGVTRRRYTGGSLAGKPMARPWKPSAWDVRALGRKWSWSTAIDVWHTNPSGLDTGDSRGCGYCPRDLSRFGWAWRHRTHMHINVIPVRRVVRWLRDRCAICGRRFLWRDARYGMGWDSPEVAHEACHSREHLRRQRDEAWDYIVAPGAMSETARWRVEYQVSQHFGRQLEGEGKS